MEQKDIVQKLLDELQSDYFKYCKKFKDAHNSRMGLHEKDAQFRKKHLREKYYWGKAQICSKYITEICNKGYKPKEMVVNL